MSTTALPRRTPLPTRFTPTVDTPAVDASSVATAAHAPAVVVRALDLWYGRFHALHGVTLEIPATGILALVGPSGCGKSTLLRCLNRMNDLVPDMRVTGEVLVGGANVLGAEVDVDALRRTVGMVFQKPNPFPLSIRDNLTFGPAAAGVRGRAQLDQIARDALERVGLWSVLGARWHERALALPPEQQQRLCIARMLTTAPSVLLFDEPCSTLDPAGTAVVETLMLDLAREHPVVVVTHNMQQALRLGGRMAFMLLGDLVETGDTAALFADAADHRTRDYLNGRFG